MKIKFESNGSAGTYADLYRHLPGKLRDVGEFPVYWYASWEPKKKKSWIQKIRGYDALESRLFLAEQMRDHNRVMADAWKERVENVGRRLKFSVGHNHVEIIVGNPVTVAENFNTETTDETGGNTETAYTICSSKDTYNWKTGVIKALENLCHENDYTGDFTARLFEAMKKKYQEVFAKERGEG